MESPIRGLKLEGGRFDEYVESRCRQFYTDGLGRPGLAPDRYFRLLEGTSKVSTRNAASYPQYLKDVA